MQSKKKKKIALSHVAILIITLLFLSLSVLLFVNNNLKSNIFIRSGLKQDIYNSNNLCVHFIDVGQGDCSLIQCKDTNILIDTGDEVYSSKVVEYMIKNGIDSLDYIIISHPHLDHIGGLIDIISKIETNKIIMRDIPKEDLIEEYNIDTLLDFADKNNIEICCPKFNEKLKIDKLELRFLFQDKYDNINDSSLITEIKYSGKQLTFTGDIEENSENFIAKYVMDTDILKVAHHGSKTSSTVAFLTKVKPKISIISCGSDNNFGHPSDEIVSRLSNFSNNIFRTDLCGNIMLDINDCNIKVFTEKGDNYVIN